MRTLLILLVLGAAAPAAAPPAPVDDSHDLVLLTAKRPYRVRLHLRIADQAFLTAWNQQTGHLFRYLDADGDGQLSPAEVKRAPSQDEWRQLSGSSTTIDPDEAPNFRDLARGKSHATLLDLQSYFATSNAGPMRVAWSWNTATGDPLSDHLWRQLDTNKDGKLSKAELLAARRVLAALDADEDEMVTMGELMPNRFGDQPFLLAPGRAHGSATGGLPFFSLRPGEPTAELDKELVRRYGRRPDLPLDLELLVPLDGADQPVRVRKGPSASFRFETTRHGEAIVVDDWLVELVRPRPTPSRPRPRETPALATFQAMDSNGDGYLDSEEIYKPPFPYVSWLRLADRDGDGKLSKAEFLAFSDLKQTIQGRVTTLRTERLGRSLFRFADEDGDARLGARELNLIWPRLGPWVGKRDTVERHQLPWHFRLTFSYGLLEETPRQSPFDVPARIVVPERGPRWFHKMDRNRDGDLSLKEWLGTVEQFRQIDTDGDGLIGLGEAEKFDRRKRETSR